MPQSALTIYNKEEAFKILAPFRDIHEDAGKKYHYIKKGAVYNFYGTDYSFAHSYLIFPDLKQTGQMRLGMVTHAKPKNRIDSNEELGFLGEGQYGQVKCILCDDGEVLAYKSQINYETRQEVNILRMMDYLHFSGSEKSRPREEKGERKEQKAAERAVYGKRIIIMDYFPGKSIESSCMGLQSDQYLFDKEVDFVSALKNIIDQVNNLHTKGFIHGDIHSGNILYNSETKTATLIDFGFVKNTTGCKYTVKSYLIATELQRIHSVFAKLINVQSLHGETQYILAKLKHSKLGCSANLTELSKLLSTVAVQLHSQELRVKRLAVTAPLYGMRAKTIAPPVAAPTPAEPKYSNSLDKYNF